MFRFICVRGFILATLALLASQSQAAASTTIGKSDALRCYEESRLALSISSISYCDRAIEKGNLTRRDLAATYSNRGIIYAGNGDFSRALKDHNMALNLTPTLAEAYINRGNVYFHTKAYKRALEDYDRAISLNTTPIATAWYNKALSLLRLKRNTEARRALENALKLAPDSRKIQEQLARFD